MKNFKILIYSNLHYGIKHAQWIPKNINQLAMDSG